MVEIVQDPQLRYTADNQIPIAEMLVKFPNLRNDSFAVLKVIGWGNLAQEINEKYHQGDCVIVEGRLAMNTLDRPEGFKEKRAELTAKKIYMLDLGATGSSSDGNMSEVDSTPSNVVQLSSRNRNSSPTNSPGSEPMQPTPSQEESETDFDSPTNPENPDYDPIPF